MPEKPVTTETTSSQHVRRAQHNEQFAQHFDLETTPYRDWVVTAYFYAAVHWIDAYLAQVNQRAGDHAARFNRINNDVPELTPISRTYRKLFSYSLNVRYELVEFSPSDVRSMVIPKMREVKEFAKKLLGLNQAV